jgi:hypothetical protein
VSVRPAKLCDCLNSRLTDDGEPCEKPAVAVCLVCAKDICADHTTALMGGIRLLVEIRDGGEKCLHGMKMPETRHSSDVVAALCLPCRHTLQSSHTILNRVKDSSEELLAVFAKILKAAFSEEALK